MRLRSTFVTAAIVSVLTDLPFVSASPTGAGGCAGGTAAVGGGHLRDGAITGSLSDGGITLRIGGIALTGDSTVDITAMEDISITASASDMPMKGILVRLEAGDTDLTGTLSVDDDALLQDANVCASPVAGITHTSNVDKTEVAMTMMVPEEMMVTVDVTVVMQNNGDGSIYYYDQFLVNVLEGNGGSEAEPAPSETPGANDAPTVAPVDTPTATGPTDAPVETPTSSGPGTMMIGLSSFVLSMASLLWN
ncbi:Reeler domain containing protein [Nitzschia inconspicua]|uniref:Reeler domain containing protein n=1 Tax=Nitzschia inconspicua TaxID=303405 RepID=A0A9K3Q459_9STRA|nr:Reeler domain containing protein [Nitzschia inconspicua]